VEQRKQLAASVQHRWQQRKPQRHQYGTYPAPQPNGIPDPSHSLLGESRRAIREQISIFINIKGNHHDERIQKKPD
jgi:hypothetical protein